MELFLSHIYTILFILWRLQYEQYEIFDETDVNECIMKIVDSGSS